MSVASAGEAATRHAASAAEYDALTNAIAERSAARAFEMRFAAADLQYAGCARTFLIPVRGPLAEMRRGDRHCRVALFFVKSVG